MILEVPRHNENQSDLELEQMTGTIKPELQRDSAFYSFDRHDYSDLVKARTKEIIE